MVDPLSVDIVSVLSKDPLALPSGAANLASGEFGALLTGDPQSLLAQTPLAQTPIDVEAAAVLDLVDQAVTEASLIAGSAATVAAATLELSPEALAQAAAAGLPATLFDDSPAFPRPLEARRFNPDGGVLPVSGLDHWQAAIQLFKEGGSSAPAPQFPAPAPRICPFCGKVHTVFVGEDRLSASEESCAAYTALQAEKNSSPASD
jgi:hypothetical protein